MSVSVERFVTEGIALVSYVISDEGQRSALLIDPSRDVEQYLDYAAARGLTFAGVLETHVHADFASGSLEFAHRAGVPIYASRLGQLEFQHVPIDDGQRIRFGEAELEAFFTPGHTPEHMSYLLFEESRDPRPTAMFSGDLLFVGEVGRPDLLGPKETEALTQQLYESLFQRLPGLPAGLIVYPGHGAGSSCGRSIGDAPYTTLGQERLTNYALQPRTFQEFRHVILDDMPPAPNYYPVMKWLNKIGPPLLESLRPGEALDVERFDEAISQGGVIIDTRTNVDFARAHIPGSISIGLGPNFAPWSGWLAPYEQSILLVLNDDEQYAGARDKLRLIGLDTVTGYLSGGLPAWESSGRETQSFEAIGVDELHSRLKTGDLQLVDVRSDDEWKVGHIKGAEHRFAGAFVKDADAYVSGDEPIALICGSGYRSSVVASLLNSRGRQDVINVIGGMEIWTSAGYPTT
ncbi:MAG TPA: rhodanese-like domain-containing protein [Thermomicrobiaceae bacterium]|nr:rhodanese-like domain-containing protein [Thermomicrobiaceae bacterium]